MDYKASLGRDTSDPSKAVLLYLSGLRLADIKELPEVTNLLQHGVLVELAPAPITGPLTQHYQTLSGRSPACFGLFDTLVTRNYTVGEEISGRSTPPRLLPDILQTVGWAVQYEEIAPSELGACIQVWAQGATHPAPTASPACLIIKCTMQQGVDEAEEVTVAAIGQALHIARTVVGETGLLAVCSDTQPAPVKQFVNINNFLADMGIIERDEQTGQIHWPNSLAYYAGYGQLWINLLGRDAQGAVHPQDDYQEVLDTLVKALPTKLRHGQAPVIERVYRKEELYSSEYLFCAPDLVVVFAPGYAPSPESTRIGFDQAVFTTPTANTVAIAGVHPASVKGFLLASAPALANNVVLSSTQEPVPLTAVVPTLLHALNVEYVDVDSQAVAGLFAPSYLETHPLRSPRQSQDLSEEDEEKIISHLRDLGYV